MAVAGHLHLAAEGVVALLLHHRLPAVEHPLRGGGASKSSSSGGTSSSGRAGMSSSGGFAPGGSGRAGGGFPGGIGRPGGAPGRNRPSSSSLRRSPTGGIPGGGALPGAHQEVGPYLGPRQEVGPYLEPRQEAVLFQAVAAEELFQLVVVEVPCQLVVVEVPCQLVVVEVSSPGPRGCPEVEHLPRCWRSGPRCGARRLRSLTRAGGLAPGGGRCCPLGEVPPGVGSPTWWRSLLPARGVSHLVAVAVARSGEASHLVAVAVARQGGLHQRRRCPLGEVSHLVAVAVARLGRPPTWWRSRCPLGGGSTCGGRCCPLGGGRCPLGGGRDH